MTKRIKKNLSKLQTLYKCSPKEQSALLRIAKPDLIHTLCDCITNIVHNRVPISSKQRGLLLKKKNILRKFSDKKTGTSRKKKLLVQHGGSILSVILRFLDSC